MAKTTVYGFTEMNYVSAAIEEVELEGHLVFDPQTGELQESPLCGWYYRTFGQAKKAAISMLRLEIRQLQQAIKYVRALTLKGEGVTRPCHEE